MDPDQPHSQSPTSRSGSSSSSRGWLPPSIEEMQAMLPQYVFESLLGRGGMGAVYKAVQVSLERPVAIKVLPGDLIDDTDVNFVERFKNEARTMAKMSHPAIVNVFDFGGTQTGLLYFVMEFIDGTDVSKMILSQGRLPPEHALAITAHVCDALNYAHSRGIVHRDIKPANILINMEGQVKVADFGLAKANDPSVSGLTKTNMAMGTPDFVAPEALVAGIPLDGRADLYAVGVMLYNMLTGEIPRGLWMMPSLRFPGMDRRFDAIIARAMQTDREARYQSATEIRHDLNVILTVPIIKAEDTAARQPPPPSGAAHEEPSPPAKQPSGQRPAKPLGRPAAPSAQQARPKADAKAAAAPPKKKMSALFIGIAAAVIIGGGLVFMMNGKKPADAEAAAANSDANASGTKSAPNRPAETTATSAAKASAPAPVLTAVPPGGGWIDWLAAQRLAGALPKEFVPEGEGFRITGAGSRVVAAAVMAFIGPEMRDGAVRVTFQRADAAQPVHALLRALPAASSDSPYAATYRLQNDRGNCQLSHRVYDGPAGPVFGAKSSTAAGDTTREHVLEFRIIGDRMEAIFDGETQVTASHSALRSGLPGVLISNGVWVRKIEVQNLDAAPVASGAPPPAAGPLTFGGHRYQAVSEPGTWSGAKAKAEAMGGHLAVITSAAENDWIRATFIDQLDDGKMLWIGATNSGPDGKWKWVTGEEIGFSNWVPKALLTQVNVVAGFIRNMANVDVSNVTGWALWELPNPIPARQKGFIVEWDDNAPAATTASPARASTPAASSTSPITWTDSSGRTLTATFKGIEGDQVVLEVLGKPQRLLLSNLSAASQQQARALASASSTASTSATKDAPFVNSLGMKFVPVPGTNASFSVWLTRVQDYAAYAAANPQVDGSWKTQDKEGAPIGREADHPVVAVSWDDAQAFCAWLTAKEQAEGKLPKDMKYRLPSDEEWSTAVGLPPEQGATPEAKDSKNTVDFPWGKAWPPPAKAGNYADETFHAQFPKPDPKNPRFTNPWIAGYTDGYATTSPVGGLTANAHGLHDMGGNVWQWCEDGWNAASQDRVLRGNSFPETRRERMLSSARHHTPPGVRYNNHGFRCVLSSSAGAAASSSPAVVTTPSQPAPDTGMRDLFNGRDFTGWTGPGGAAAADSWRVEGATFSATKRTTLWSQEAFGDCEIDLEWKIGPRTAGGVFYLVNGASELGNPEMQLVDPALGAAGGGSGSLFKLVPEKRDASKPPGEWNSAKLVISGSKREHWINGELVCSWDASQFRDKPGFATTSGKIVLQANDNTVAYRNVRVRSPGGGVIAAVPSAPAVTAIPSSARDLFNGRDATGWTGPGGAPATSSWRVEGTTFTPTQERTTLWSEESFGDFEFEIEWKVGPRGNGGIFYHVSGTNELEAPEMQVCDPANAGANRSGALYGIMSETRDASKPLGEWNTAKLVANGPKREHWINGELVASYDVSSAEFQRALAASKTKARPNFATSKGKFVLQGYGGSISYRNARIRVLGSSGAPAAAVPTTPNSALPTPNTSDPRLAQLDAVFKTEYAAKAQQTYDASVAALNTSYVGALGRARTAAQTKGVLAEVTAIDDELKRIQNNEGVPAADEAGAPAALTTLRKTYRDTMAKHTAIRAAAAAPVYDAYLKALDAYIAELTRADKLEDAKRVKAVRDEVAKQKAGP